MIKQIITLLLLASPALAETRSLLNFDSMVDGACFVKPSSQNVGWLQICTFPSETSPDIQDKFVLFTFFTKKIPRLSHEQAVFIKHSASDIALPFDSANTEKVYDNMFKTTYMLKINQEALALLVANSNSLEFRSDSFKGSVALSKNDLGEILLISRYL